MEEGVGWREEWRGGSFKSNPTREGQHGQSGNHGHISRMRVPQTVAYGEFDRDFVRVGLKGRQRTQGRCGRCGCELVAPRLRQLVPISIHESVNRRGANNKRDFLLLGIPRSIMLLYLDRVVPIERSLMDM